MFERILRISHIERSELELVRSLFSLHFLVICAFIVAKTGRDGLYLSELPARTLPYVYIGLAVWTAVAISLFGRFTRRLAPNRALAHGLWATAVSLLLFSLLFRIAPGALAVVFYLWIGAYGLLLVSQFWILANERVNPRQARRLFGVIGAGGILGGMVGGAGASQIGKAASPEWLLVVAAGVHFAAAVVAARSAPRDEEVAPERGELPAAGEAGIKGILKKPYVRLVAGLVLMGAVTSAVVDYEFKFLLQRQLADPAQIEAGLSPEKAAWLTMIVGYFYGAQNLVALIVQVGLTGYLLSRLGARTTSVLLPAGLLIGSVATVAVPLFSLVAVTWLYESIARVSVVRSAREFLYFPLPGRARDQTKRLMEGVVSRSAEGAAGLVIIAINSILGGSILHLSAVVAILSVAAIMVERLLKRAYASELSFSLRWMLAERTQPDVSYREAKLVDELHRLLESGYEKPTLYAVQMLLDIDTEGLKEKLPGLIQHPSSRIRARALELSAEQNVVTDIRTVEPLLKDPDGEVRLHAAYFYCVLGPGDPHAAMAQLLGSESGRVRSGAFQCVAAHSPPDEDDKVDVIAREFLARGEVSDRIAVATAAGRRAPPSKLHQHIQELIRDPNPLVSRAAIRSVPGAGRRDLIPTLIELLGHPELSEDSENALARYGDRVVGTLGDHLADPMLPVVTKKKMPRVLSLVGSQNAVNALLRVPLDADPTFSEQVLRALGRIRRDNAEMQIPEGEVARRIRREIDWSLRLLQHREALGRETECAARDLLLRVLGERSTQALRRLFRILALIYPRKGTRLAYRGLVSRNVRLRAQAIEYLESILSAEHRRLILPIVEPTAWQDRIKVASQRLGRSKLTLEETLREIVDTPDPWLKACALYVIGTVKLGSLHDVVAKCTGSSEPMVLEMARWAEGGLEGARKDG